MKIDKQLRKLQAYYGVHTHQFIGFMAVFVLLVALKTGLSLKKPAVHEDHHDKLMAWLDSAKDFETTSQPGHYRSDTINKNQLFDFNPNQVSLDEMMSLGMPKWLAERIEKFRSKNGVFRKKEDLKKIYGFPEPLYTQLEPFIQIAEKQSFSPNKTQPIAQQTRAVFELNTADTTQLIGVRGIASKRAAAIVAYREKLGGYYDYSQLLEVYSLKNSPEVIENLKAKTTLNPALIKKIPINSADTSTLRPHPYLGFKRAKALVAYRENHGRFKSIEDLKKLYALDSVTIRKIAPYLLFD